MWQDMFTLNTAGSYRAMFPDAKIVISTWQEESYRLCRETQTDGIELVFSDKPGNPGINNTNFQMVTAHAGIARANELGVEFVMKTRTDQRIYNNLTLDILHNWIRTNPLAEPSNRGQSERVIFLSLNSFLYRMYGLSDMFTFSHVSDALDYWSGRLDDRSTIDHANTLREWVSQRPVEVWFYSEWLRKHEPLEWTLEHYWRSLSERTVVLDSSSLDLYWPKYTSRENRWQKYLAVHPFQEVTENHWHLIKSGVLMADESILDIEFFRRK